MNRDHTNLKPTLVILAAGMGSRYGGLKQLDPLGPNGEFIIDFSIYDALRAGFKKIVFVIRKEIASDFKKIIGRKYEKLAEISYVFQHLSSKTEGTTYDRNRKKPWGTAHAVLVAEGELDSPFLVINADDFYGFTAFRDIFTYIMDPANSSRPNYAMIGYKLGNTVSNFGYVARGICSYDDEYNLLEINERTRIIKEQENIVYHNGTGESTKLDRDELVSMNFWGFNPTVFPFLQRQFQDFLSGVRQNPAGEFYIPTMVNHLLLNRRARVKILPSREKWFGITYKNDREKAGREINELIRSGQYPEKLF